MTELLSVEQRTRDFAAEYLRARGLVTPREATLIIQGDWDETEHVQAIARFSQSLPPTQGVVEALREALKPFAQVLIDVGDSPQDPDSEDAFGHLADHPLTVGELRRARDAYQASLPLASIGEEVA